MLKILMVIYSFIPFTLAAEDNFLEQFISADYALVGQVIDTEETYRGKVSIYLDEK